MTVYRKLFFFLISNTMFLYIDFLLLFLINFPIYILGHCFIYIGVTPRGFKHEEIKREGKIDVATARGVCSRS